MIPRIYIDTSVVGGCFDKEYEKESTQLWREFKSGKKIAVASDTFLSTRKRWHWQMLISKTAR